jgi:hypothetical protein
MGFPVSDYPDRMEKTVSKVFPVLPVPLALMALLVLPAPLALVWLGWTVRTALTASPAYRVLLGRLGNVVYPARTEKTVQMVTLFPVSGGLMG